MFNLENILVNKDWNFFIFRNYNVLFIEKYVYFLYLIELLILILVKFK